MDDRSAATAHRLVDLADSGPISFGIPTRRSLASLRGEGSRPKAGHVDWVWQGVGRIRPVHSHNVRACLVPPGPLPWGRGDLPGQSRPTRGGWSPWAGSHVLCPPAVAVWVLPRKGCVGGGGGNGRTPLAGTGTATHPAVGWRSPPQERRNPRFRATTVDPRPTHLVCVSDMPSDRAQTPTSPPPRRASRRARGSPPRHGRERAGLPTRSLWKMSAGRS